MKKFGRVVRGIALLAVIVVMASCGVAGAAYPEKKVEIIYHSQAGSGGDIFLRSLAKFLEGKFKVPVLVNNVTGASGANAWNRAAHSKPDGYTLLGVSSTFVASPIQNNIPLNYTDFDPVARMFIDPVAIYVSAESPYKTLNDFLDDAKKRPGELTLTGGTAGNIEFVTARALMQAAGVSANIVPFEGGSDGVVSVLGGHVTAGIGEFAEMASVVKSGKIRVLATFNKIPTENIQTVSEAGYPQIVVEKFRGIVLPKGSPQEVKDVLITALREALEDPDFKQYCAVNYIIPAFTSGEDFSKVMELQTEQVKESLAK
jgi:putative tricarboxylic transport membrane protein